MRACDNADRVRLLGNIATAVAMLGIAACAGSGSNTTAPPATGSVTVSVTVHGNGHDANGFAVNIGNLFAPVQPGTPATLSSIPAGNVTATLSGLGPGCSADMDSIVTHVTGGDTAAVQFAVGCYGAIAYGIANGVNETQIVYLDENGHAVQVTSGTSRNVMLDFSRDGSRILFASNRNGSDKLFAVGIDGAGLVQLTSGSDEDVTGRWSPDGSKVVFYRASAGGSGSYSVYVVDANGSNETLLLDSAHIDFDPSWTPDGSKIIFACDRFSSLTRELCSMTPTGTGLAQIGSFSDVQFPVTDPTGAYIAFQGYGSATTIWVTPVNGSSAVNLTPSVESLGFDWAPDGTKLALYTSGGSGGYLVQRINRDGSGLTPLTTAADSAGDPHWSPDGGRIAFRAVRGATGQIWVVDPNGGDWHRVTSDVSGTFLPFWSPAAHSTAAVARAVRR